MDSVYVPLLSALGGAVIGSASSLLTIYLQARIGDRRERLKQAAMLAVEDHKGAVEVAKSRPGGGMIQLAPIMSYLHFYVEVLDALESRSLTAETLRGIRKRNKEVIDFAREITNEANPPKRP